MPALPQICVAGIAGIRLVVVQHVLVECQPNLFQIALAGRPASILADFGKDGKQNCREYRNNGDDNEQFNKREGTVGGREGAARRSQVSGCPFLGRGQEATE